MKYKDYPRVNIGTSDIAALTVRSQHNLFNLTFGGDDTYRAYIVDDKAEIGEHYKLVFEGETWIKIYDDNELTFDFHSYGSKIKIFRSGDYGIILQFLNTDIAQILKHYGY